MENYTITIRTISPLCLGSGQADVNVDADIVHDKYGLPYFPGKRLRGLLYESALEVSEMAALCGQPFLTKRTVDELFHHVSDSPVRFIIPDFHLPDYEKMIEDWQVLQTTFKDTIRPENVLDYYTSLRFQTAIDEKTWIAKDHSLRNIRVLARRITFKDPVSLVKWKGSILYWSKLFVKEGISRESYKRYHKNTVTSRPYWSGQFSHCYLVQ